MMIELSLLDERSLLSGHLWYGTVFITSGQCL